MIGSVHDLWELGDWLSSRNFFINFFKIFLNLLLCKFLLLFCCFRTKFQGGAKVFMGANCLRGASSCPPLPPLAPLWKKARVINKTFKTSFSDSVHYADVKRALQTHIQQLTMRVDHLTGFPLGTFSGKIEYIVMLIFLLFWVQTFGGKSFRGVQTAWRGAFSYLPPIEEIQQRRSKKIISG